MIVYVKMLKPNAIMPQIQYADDSGGDLHACLDAPKNLAPNSIEIIPTGVAIEIADSLWDRVSYEAQVRPRSSMSARGLLVAFGTIDCRYRGEIKATIYNLSGTWQTINPTDRIAQLVIAPFVKVSYVKVDKLSVTERGDRGYGSTGV